VRRPVSSQENPLPVRGAIACGQDPKRDPRFFPGNVAAKSKLSRVALATDMSVPLFAKPQSPAFTLESILTCRPELSAFGGRRTHRPVMTTTAPASGQVSVFWFFGFPRNDHKEPTQAPPSRMSITKLAPRDMCARSQSSSLHFCASPIISTTITPEHVTVGRTMVCPAPGSAHFESTAPRGGAATAWSAYNWRRLCCQRSVGPFHRNKLVNRHTFSVLERLEPSDRRRSEAREARSAAA
jgi:hypothetical protein